MPSLLTPTRPERTERWPWLAVPLSLLGHALGVAAFLFLSWATSPPRPVKPAERRPVTLRRIDSRQWAANRSARSAQLPERPAPTRPEGQVVDVAPGNDVRPDEAKYVATTDNRVMKETRAREQTNTWSRATPKTQQKPEAMPAAKGEAPAAPQPSAVSLAESFLGRRTAPSLLLPDTVGGATGTEASTSPAGDASGTENGSTEGQAEGGGAPNDHLDVPEGDGTFLNTREWKYAAFFNRVKQAVSAKWDPNGRLRHRSEGLGGLSRLTVMHVTLRPDGTLADLYVAQSSGVDVLDAEAMSAFEKAAPFANPPPALVERGFIQFFFSFHVTNEGLAVPRPFRFR
ncbi:MAG: TonB family protein [Myxococcaceae bacterium]|nr:TonB family protein [Myxococcaceae bacterium]